MVFIIERCQFAQLVVIAVTNMPYPTNVKELQRLLGILNYLGKFIPNLSTHTFNI